MVLRRFAELITRGALCVGAVVGGVELARRTHSSSAGMPTAAPSDEQRHASVAFPSMPEVRRRPTADEAPDRELSRERLDTALGKHLKNGKVITGATEHRLVLFSFDDGPDRRTTPLLLDRLDAEGIKAVFFLAARRIRGDNLMQREQAEIAREIVRRGHLVANHTVDHEQLPLLNDEQVLEQVVGAERIFERVLGDRPWLIRPPGGARSQRIDELLAERGYTTVMWNLGSGDFQVRSADQVFETWRRVFERRREEEGERGGIILLHDTYTWSIDAFQRIVAYLRERNCQLLRQGEELYDIVDDPALFFEPRRDALPGSEAAPAAPPEDVLQARQARLRAETARRCGTVASAGSENVPRRGASR